ncbi:Adenylyl cyclase-associated protein 1-like isoform X2 [Oopsacas minuta]|uniref:Adenylyl cyclase-associated protein 1-like isoform X2 n=1 Tax=Oopsacas minuta TaxID=111878 RepID=A0AAV7JC13_9METZ|nr:Adenylyl cyclase-associated protein 1-like isoform X2 [Oopsacas minuta]
MDKLNSVVDRLEAVTNKLEGIADKGTLRGTGGAGETPEFVGAFDKVLASLSEFDRLSNLIGGDVAEIRGLVSNAMNEVKAFIVLAGQHKKPADVVIAKLLVNVNSASEKLVEFAESKRADKSMNNMFAVKELFPYSFGFLIQMKPKKIPKQALDQGMFYSNRVLKEFKDKDSNQVDWCRSLAKYTTALTTYIEEYLPGGMEWNPEGSPITSDTSAPPPAASKAPATQESSTASIADAFQGGNVTEGLKKVDRSQMTHKNPELKASSLVKAKESGLDKPMKGDVTIPKKDPLLRLEKKRWRIEHFEGKNDLTITPTENSHTLYVFNCSKCTISVTQKINSITLDKCFQVAIVFEDVISQFETINCQRIEAQSNGQLPLINIDKTDQVSIYLSENSKNAEIVQAKSSAMNILLPQADGEFKEVALPEQFKSILRGSRYVTTPTDSI